MKLFLSYPLKVTDLAWPGEPVLTTKQCTEISDACPFESHLMTIPNHFGTHYDAPAHFHKGTTKIAELPVEYFAFDDVLLLEIPKNAAEGVMIADLEPHIEEIKKAKLLIIRTGFGPTRLTDPKKYQMEGPFLHPDTCAWMVRNLPDLNTVGFDFLAIGSPCNDMAAPAHQNLLGCFTDKFITAIEDMKLDEIPAGKKINAVYANPLRVVGVDSAQVSVIADIED